MDELERFRIRMIGEEHNRRRREAERRRVRPIVILSTVCAIVKAWLLSK